MSWIDSTIEAAQKLGGMSAAAIFALISMSLAYKDYRREKWIEESNEKWRGTRDSGIRAEEGQTAIVGRLVDVTAKNTTAITSMSGKIDVLVALIKDRKDA